VDITAAVTNAALTKTDDTNVTLTLGGSPTTALLAATSLTLGWIGQLAEIRGGTNQSTYAAGDLLYASAINTLAKRAIGTANQILITSGGVPVWSTMNSLILGGIDNHSDVDTTTSVPLTGDSLVFNGINWVPSSATAAGTNNYVFSFDTTAQAIALINTWQDVIYDTNGEISDWTHTIGTADFTCSTSGLYAATVEANVERTGNAPSAALRALFNGVYIPGSHQGMDITSNNTTTPLSRTFLFDAVAGQIFKVQVSSTRTTVSIKPAPAPGGGVTAVSSSVTIRRLT
jgi:hypothetical protein